MSTDFTVVQQAIYIVEALRHGNREKHSYVVGAYTTLKSALYAAEVEESWRGGKYSCEISKAVIDSLNADKVEFHESCFEGTDD